MDAGEFADRSLLDQNMAIRTSNSQMRLVPRTNLVQLDVIVRAGHRQIGNKRTIKERRVIKRWLGLHLNDLDCVCPCMGCPQGNPTDKSAQTDMFQEVTHGSDKEMIFDLLEVP